MKRLHNCVYKLHNSQFARCFRGSFLAVVDVITTTVRKMVNPEWI